MSMITAGETGGLTFKNNLKGVSEEMQQCLQNCLTCHQICEQMVTHCLEKGGMHATPKHIKLLQDCADICALSADFLLRGSNFHSRTCGVCAEICRACAEDCRSMADDEAMKICADACQRCAETCSQMSSFQH